MQRLQVFVSPFGIGEFSGKDYEIIMAGGLLIKPLADRLVSFPNIYNKNYSISTGADFSDLEERVMPFLQDRAGLARAQSIVDSARELLLRYSTKEIFAARLDELLTRLLIRA